MGRGHVELAHARDVGSSEIPARGWPAGTATTVLSRDPDGGAFTGILHLPAGYRRPAGVLPGDSELLVLSGGLWIGSAPRPAGFYEYHPGGSGHEEWAVAEQPCELFFKAGGVPDFEPGAVAADERHVSLDTARMEWMVTPVPGPPPGITVKILRTVEETGELAALVANPPRYDYARLEYHDCVEEMYCIEGDMRLGNSGLMTPGSYFWRPAYVTHGPFYSHTGVLMYLWVASTLVNHFVEDPRRTPEENRAEAHAQAPAA